MTKEGDGRTHWMAQCSLTFATRSCDVFTRRISQCNHDGTRASDAAPNEIPKVEQSRERSRTVSRRTRTGRRLGVDCMFTHICHAIMRRIHSSHLSVQS